MEHIDGYRERIDALDVATQVDYYERYQHVYRYLFAKRFVYGMVLDAGCGYGYGAYILAQSPKVQHVLGIDISEEAINYAKSKYENTKCHFSIGDLESIDLGRACYNCVVFFECLEHLARPFEVLTKMRRSLVDNGLLILSTPNRSNLFRKFYPSRKNPYHVKEYYYKEVLEILKSAGFLPLACYGQCLPPPFFMRIKTLRNLKVLTKIVTQWPKYLPHISFYQIWLAVKS
jgi:SAM-dependent methyltransferase